MTRTKPRSTLLLGAVLLGGTMLATSSAHAQLRFWTTEEQPERLARQEAMAEAFEAETGIAVEVIPVTETELGVRATAALAAGDLPDVIYHPLQYVLPWSEAGILDSEAATEVIEALDVSTFAPGALEMASVADGYAAVPVDGWTQMVLYRADLFEAAGLEPPTTFAAIEGAIDALHNPPDMYGFVAATKVDENFMSQVLEHVFLANGVSPVDADGLAPLDEAATIEVLEFYAGLAEASPPGDLFWQQSRELYLDGRAAMIIWSPFILDELAGLRDSAPVTMGDDPTSSDLAAATGVVTTLAGPSNPDGAAWADIRYIGVTLDADYDARDTVRRIHHERCLHRDAGHRAGREIPGSPRHHGRSGRLCRSLVPAPRRRRPVRAVVGAVPCRGDRRHRQRPGDGGSLGRRGRPAFSRVADRVEPDPQPAGCGNTSTVSAVRRRPWRS